MIGYWLMIPIGAGWHIVGAEFSSGSAVAAIRLARRDTKYLREGDERDTFVRYDLAKRKVFDEMPTGTVTLDEASRIVSEALDRSAALDRLVRLTEDYGGYDE